MPRLFDEYNEEEPDPENEWHEHLPIPTEERESRLRTWAQVQGAEASVANDYTADWEQISRQKREAENFRCQRCKADLEHNHRLLHVHHIDGDKTDNQDSNLLVLCVLCHAEEDGHRHLLLQVSDEVKEYILASRPKRADP